jgi:hypothetical protein
MRESLRSILEPVPQGLRRIMIRKWEEPREFEPAHAYFPFIVGLNQQTSARVFANEMGFGGREMQPSECLDAVRHLPIDRMDDLIHATPRVTATTVQLMGTTFRRKQWTGTRPRVCPACLAESPHFRTFHGLTSMTVCPFHGFELISAAGEGDALGWWHPQLSISPRGVPLARAAPRLDPLPETFERWLLGKLKVCEPISVPLLDNGSVAEAIDAVDLLGKVVLGGWRVLAPKTGEVGFGRKEVNTAGFNAYCGGAESLEVIFRDLAQQAEGQKGQRGLKWGMQHAYGWVYDAAFSDFRASAAVAAVCDAALTVAKRSGRFFRGSNNLKNGVQIVARIHRAELARDLGIKSQRVDPIAARLGIVPTREADHFVLYELESVKIIRAALADTLPRNDAAKMLSLSRPEFDKIERYGLISRLCRVGGGTVQHDRFRRCELNKLLPGYADNLLPVEPNDARFVEFKTFAQGAGLSPSDLLQRMAKGDLLPSARCLDRPGINGFLFDHDDLVQLNHAKSSLPLENTVKLRRQIDRPGVTCVDAAARFGVTMEVIKALIDCGLLRLVDPLASGTTRPRVTLKGLDSLCRLYAPATAYSDVLSCPPRRSGQTLKSLGVPVKAIPRRDGKRAYIVLRAAVVKTLGWTVDPLDEGGHEWLGLWQELGKYLANNKSVFRLTFIRNQPEALLRSGDRRTSIHVRIAESGKIITRMKCHATICARRTELDVSPDISWVSDGPHNVAIEAVGSTMDPRNPDEYLICFKWIEATACRFRAIREGWQRSLGLRPGSDPALRLSNTSARTAVI